MSGDELVPDYLEVDWLLSQFSDNRYQAIKVYADFVQKVLVQKSNWDDLNQAISLGNEDFINKVHTKAGLLKNKLSEIPKKQKRTPARSLMFFEETYVPRDEAMARAYLTGAYSMKKMGDYFNVHYVTISRAVKKY